MARGSGCAEHGAAPEDDAAPQAPEVEPPSIPGYRVLEVLGFGGFGTVYRAERRAEGPAAAEVALKVARTDRPGAAERLRRELDALREIGPPHVPAVHAWGALAGSAPWIAMEHVSAPTLADRLAAWSADGALDLAGSLAPAVLRALEAVHARGWVHRDLKPENVFVDGAGGLGRRAPSGDPVPQMSRGLGRRAPSGDPEPQMSTWAKLFDFGLAARRAGAEEENDAGAAEVAGTAEYMAPEQCAGQAAADPRVDVYAMGVVLYELLAGRPPFWGPRALVHEAHRVRRPPPLRAFASVPPALEEVVLRCLAKDPWERFEDAAALRRALERALAAPAAGARPLGPARAEGGAAGPASAAESIQRRHVGLVFFETDASPLALQRRLLLLGGELAHVSGRRAVALYGHDVGDNPARRALRAARDLVEGGLCERARVDLAAVPSMPRRSGGRRYASALFGRGDRFPRADAPGGVDVAPAAAAVLGDLGSALRRGPPSSRPGAPAAAPGAGDRAATQKGATLFGRYALLAALIGSARDVVAGGPPAIVTVLGDVGLGKTALGGALATQLGALAGPGAVLELEAREPEGAGGSPLVRALLRHALRLSEGDAAGEAALRERLAPLGLAERWPAVALALGSIPHDAPVLRALLAAPGALRSAVTLAIGEALGRRGAPCLVVLDDAHLADDVALAGLELAALADQAAPIWICALARPAFEQAQPGWGARAGRRDVHRLAPLDAESAAALCRVLLLPAEDAPRAVVERLVERAHAVPLLLVELVEGLKRGGLVRRNAKGDGFYLATDQIDRLPDLPLLEWLAARELDTLGPALGAHAWLVALLGEETSADEVAAVIRRLERRGRAAELPLDAKAAVERLVAAGMLVRRGADRVAFRHPMLRDAVAGSTPEPLRQWIHLAAFEHARAGDAGAPGAAGERPGAHAEGRLARMAHHAAQAGLPREAELAHQALAEHARVRHTYLEAESHYSRAIALAEAAPPLSVLRGRGLMRYRLARYPDALADFAAARAAAQRDGDVAAEIDILLDEATALDWMCDYATSAARVEQARALAAPALPPLTRARLLLGTGRSVYRQNRQEEAAALLERAAEQAAPLGDEGYETLVIALVMLGFVLQALGRLDDAARSLDRAIALCDAHGDVLHLAPAVSNRGLVRGSRGDKAGMIADFERTIALGRELGQPGLEVMGEFNLAELLYYMDDLDAAAPRAARAAIVAARQGAGAIPAVVRLLEARLRLYAGDEGAARAIAVEVRREHDRARAAGASDAVLAPAEDVLCAMIDLATRDATDAEWEALVARSAECSVGQERIEVLEARALAALRRGGAGDARRHLAEALDLAARLPNAMRARLARWQAEIERRSAPSGG